MTALEPSAFTGHNPELPEDAALRLACEARIARTKAAGRWHMPPVNNREGMNPDTGRWEYAPISADLIQRDLDAQAELRARDEAIYARVNGRPRSYAATGTIRCEDCRGDGLINADAGITGTNRFCDCPTCHGTGYRK